MADGDIRALHAVLQLFSAPQPMASMPRDFGEGIVILITQDVSANTLAEAQRRYPLR